MSSVQFKTGFHFVGIAPQESCLEQTRHLKPITISLPHLKQGAGLVLRQLGHTWQIAIASQMQEKALAIPPTHVDQGRRVPPLVRYVQRFTP